MAGDIKKEGRLASSEDLIARGHLDNLGFPRQANLPNNLDLEGFFEVGIWRTTAGLNLVGLPSGETGANGLFKQWGDVELLHGVYRNIQEYINLSTGAHYERTRHESTGTWTGWVSVDNRHRLTNTYNRFSDLGLQSPQDIQSLIDSLPNNSIYNGFNSTSEVILRAPEDNGKILIMKYNEYRTIIKYWGQGQLDNERTEYTGFSYNGDFKEWIPVSLIRKVTLGNTDWNTVVKDGYYKIVASDLTQSPNSPSGAYPYGLLRVSESKGLVLQEYFPDTSTDVSSGNSGYYTRVRYTTNWKQWLRLTGSQIGNN